MSHVTLIPALSDNYIYLLQWENFCAVVDPAEAGPVRQVAEAIDVILLTHHHGDHVGGVAELKEATGCEVVGPKDSRIQHIDTVLSEGETFSRGPLSCQIISTPGHTSIHLAYYFPKEGWLFSGDALFAGGCGRLFEGTAEQMWTSLQKLRALPDTTKLYCGHEYTLANLRFAHSLEPDNTAVKDRLERITQSAPPTIPSTLGEEKLTNPFLRADDPLLQSVIGLNTPTEVFAEVRRRKDCL